ncbi:MAG: GntR family transcriptional regulator [Cypionkella sp.]
MGKFPTNTDNLEPGLTPLKRPVRLGDEVYSQLYAQLMSHKIVPGGRISIDNLVRELGVSQTPIREALSRLEAQGLVVKTHLVGYSAASQLESGRLEQLYELRLLLEPFAARRAAAQMTRETLQSLQSLADEMQRSEQDDPRKAYSRFARLDGEFHNLISLNSGNDLVHETLSNLHTHVHLFRLFYHSRATSGANAEHALLLGALRDAAPIEAEAAMRSHIENSRARFLSYFQPATGEKPDEAGKAKVS